MANGVKLIPNFKKSLTSFEIIDIKKTFGRGKTLRRAEVLKSCYLNFYRYDQSFFRLLLAHEHEITTTFDV